MTNRVATLVTNCLLALAVPLSGIGQQEDKRFGDRPVTFSNQVVRILQSRCQSCHHPGDIAPFSLITYEDARQRSAAITYMTETRQMPPWKAAAGCGDLLDERRLTNEEIQILGLWADSGAPEGDPSQLPKPLQFTSEWALGNPDLVLGLSRDYAADVSRGDVYRCFSLATYFEEDRYVTAIDIRPGNRSMVHHVLLFTDTTNASAALDPGDGYTCFGGPGVAATSALGGWAPGSRARFLPEGVGMPLAKNSRIIMQIHYSATSTDRSPDRTSIGLYFAKSPINKRLLTLPLLNTSFVIPPNDPRHRVTASFTIPPFVNVHALAIAPHMHLLGREMLVKATLPNGREQCLIHIDDWDFHWQGQYFYKEPVALPAGTQLELTAYYDNSANNPNNPNNPPKEVRWGEATADEMCIAFISFTLDAENLAGRSGKPQTRVDDFFPFWNIDPFPDVGTRVRGDSKRKMR